MNKLQVRVLHTSRYGDYSKGDCGFIDGYCCGADNCAYAMVVIGTELVMIEPRNLTIITQHEILEPDTNDPSQFPADGNDMYER